jgi:hypothetical protein
MALLDFLSDGQPIPAMSGVKAMTTQTTLPSWYTNYAMQILADQQAQANTPYATYQGPRVAGFTPDQFSAFDATRTGATAGAAPLNTAVGATQGQLGRSSLTAATPYFTNVASMSPVAAASPYFNNAAGMSPFAAASPYLGRAAGVSGLTAAQPYFTSAGAPSTSGLSAYMNPYTDAVVNRIGDLGARTLREKLLPEISDTFTNAGQFGGTRQAEMIGRALRDTQEGISAQQSEALRSGYGEALTVSAADRARMANLGQSVGDLAGREQTALTNIGQVTGQLTAEQQRALASLGVDIGNLTGRQQDTLTQLGEATGRLSGQDVTQQLNAANQLGGLSTQLQTQGLTGAGALSNIGQQQQALNQENLKTAYGDFLKQQGYPQEQINAMLTALGGVKTAMPSLVEEAGIEPLSSPQQYTSSTGANLASGLAGIIGAFS